MSGAISHFYLIDKQKKRIDYHFDFFGIERESRFKQFDEVQTVILRPFRRHENWRTLFFRQKGIKICLVDRHNSVFTFSELEHDFCYPDLEKRAQQIAKILGCDYVLPRSIKL